MNAKKVALAVLGSLTRLTLALGVIYVIYTGAKASYDYGYRVFTEPPVALGEGREVKVAITEDMSPWKMGEMLEEKGLVRDGRLFVIQYYVSDYRKDVKPGNYVLNTNMTAEDMMAAMVGPKDEEDN